jgi:AcrR family transcriptional regulator
MTRTAAVTTTTNPLSARKQDLVRGAIWDAAIDLFTENGFEDTTIEQIAAAAGVSTRTFFRYFASKNDLMDQGSIHFQALIRSTIRDAPRTLSGVELVRYVADHVTAEVASFARGRQIIRISSSSVAARDAELSRRATLENVLAQAFAERYRTSSRDDIASRLMAGLTLSVLDVTFRTWATRTNADIGAVTANVFRTLTRLTAADADKHSMRTAIPVAKRS